MAQHPNGGIIAVIVDRKSVIYLPTANSQWQILPQFQKGRHWTTVFFVPDQAVHCHSKNSSIKVAYKLN